MHLVRGTRRSHASRALMARHASVAGVVDILDLSMEAAVERLHAAIYATKLDIEDWKNKTVAEAEERSGNPAFPQCKSGDSGDAFIANCLTKSEQAGNTFIINSWDPFLERWRAYAGKEDGAVGWVVSKANKYKWTEADNNAFNNDLEKLRAEFKSKTGAPLSTALPTKKPEDAGPGSSIRSLSTSLDNVVTVAGIGVALYFGFTYVVPLLFGAAAKSRAAKSDYTRAG